MVVEDNRQNYDAIGRNFTDLDGVTFVKTIYSLHFAYGIEFPFGKEKQLDGIVGVVNLEETFAEQSVEVPKSITKDIVNYNSDFDQGQVNELINLLNEFRTCFAFSLKELGCTDYMSMDIVDTNVPVVSRIESRSERNKISTIVQEWKDEGLMTEIKSPYA